MVELGVKGTRTTQLLAGDVMGATGLSRAAQRRMEREAQKFKDWIDQGGFLDANN